MSDDRVIQSGRFKGKKIEMAPTSGLALVRDTAEDFMREIFEMEPEDYLISDESRLRDFIDSGATTLEAIHERIRKAYSVDVSGIPQGNLVDIFVRIRGVQ